MGLRKCSQGRGGGVAVAALLVNCGLGTAVGAAPSGHLGSCCCHPWAPVKASPPRLLLGCRVIDLGSTVGFDNVDGLLNLESVRFRRGAPALCCRPPQGGRLSSHCGPAATPLTPLPAIPTALPPCLLCHGRHRYLGAMEVSMQAELGGKGGECKGGGSKGGGSKEAASADSRAGGSRTVLRGDPGPGRGRSRQGDLGNHASPCAHAFLAGTDTVRLLIFKISRKHPGQPLLVTNAKGKIAHATTELGAWSCSGQCCRAGCRPGQERCCPACPPGSSPCCPSPPPP